MHKDCDSVWDVHSSPHSLSQSCALHTQSSLHYEKLLFKFKIRCTFETPKSLEILNKSVHMSHLAVRASHL